jgi:hypothetical protein
LDRNEQLNFQNNSVTLQTIMNIEKKQPDFVIYATDDDVAKNSVRLEEETVWLTQAHLAELFQTSRPNITMHIKNILTSGELEEIVVSKNLLQTTEHGAIEGKIQVSRTCKKYLQVHTEGNRFGNSQEILVSSNRRQQASKTRNKSFQLFGKSERLF